ncbi:MAG TPA: RNA methyltransferase [Planctomycetaceae bacterium]|nr:RNA methyltransferase [Planctomycetaceae bacterium]
MPRDRNEIPHFPTVNRAITFVCRLHREREWRERHRCFYAEGLRNFLHAINARQQIATIFYSKKLLKSAAAEKQIRALKRAGTPALSLSPEEFRKISWFEHASGIGFLVRSQWSRLSQIDLSRSSCWIILETVRNTGNLGTLLRSANAFGANGLILLGHQIDPYQPDILRASMGSLFFQKFIHSSLHELEQWTNTHSLKPIGTSPSGQQLLNDFPFPKTTLIFLGEERQGMSITQQEYCHHLVRIPMSDRVDSLNLGVAGSLMIYAWMSSQACSGAYSKMT